MDNWINFDKIGAKEYLNYKPNFLTSGPTALISNYSIVYKNHPHYLNGEKKYWNNSQVHKRLKGTIKCLFIYLF